ncbi:hypothetical protein QZH41_012711 [Actinostola sp. cb2023]|nr:hypothetical protein QZH41_012711 [Actinostola sp. cb2023]
MEGEDIELTYKKGKQKRRCRCISAIVVVVILFVIGLIIGYFIGKAHKPSKHAKPATSQSEAARKEQRTNLRDSINTENLRETLRFFSKYPHIAGSPQQKKLAEELAKRWRSYGFNKVEMPEYKVLLSFPQKDKPNVVTLRYSNGTIAFQTSGKPMTPIVRFGRAIVIQHSPFAPSTFFEIAIAEKSENDPDVVPPFLGYSPSGTAEGDLVYVNYGRVEDFDQLVNKLNVSVKGKIALMRYGKIYRGDKVKNAEKQGAIAAIIYSDPVDDAPLGAEPKDVFPNTPFLPSTGVQRGSIYTASGVGDPLTPGVPSIPGIYRIPVNASGMPNIPAHPMSYGDAIHFLSQMQGATVPEDWKGALPITYRLGPGLANGMKIKLELHNKYEVQSIYNVIGTIYGKEEPDRYVLMGNHRDSWVFGAVDASSGTTTTTEIARGIGELLKKNWRPRRTIKMCSWGGEEYSLIGSREYVEQHSKDLAAKAVAYLNMDTAVKGNFVFAAAGSPLMKDVVTSLEKVVTDPNAHDDKQTLYDIMSERQPSSDGKPEFPLVGSGSDFSHFYHHIGVPVADFMYMFGHNNKTTWYPVYHTQHDTFYWLTKFADPDFLFHKAMAQFGGSLLLELADSPLLPMNVLEYTKKMNSSFAAIKNNEHLKKQNISIAYLEKAIEKFMSAADSFASVIAKIKVKEDEQSFADLRRLNDQLVQVEKSFIYSDGLYGRKYIKHVLFAPEMHNLYGVSSFPGINDAIFDAKTNGQWIPVEKQISAVIECVMAATEAIQVIAE